MFATRAFSFVEWGNFVPDTFEDLVVIQGGVSTAGTQRFVGDSFQINNITAQKLRMIADQAGSANVHVQYFRGR